MEWRTEKLTPAEVTHRNTVMYAEVKALQAKEKYENWLDNEGVTLASRISEKKRLSKEYSAKVVLNAVLYIVHLITFLLIIFNLCVLSLIAG